MYKIIRYKMEEFEKIQKTVNVHTIFLTYPWIRFLEKNQKAEPVILGLFEGDVCKGYFVGLIIKKMGIKILGSPFEGWLTCDMGFIKIKGFDINKALISVKKYAFSILKCMYIQITDKDIREEQINMPFKYIKLDYLYKDISIESDEIYESFSKQAKRYIRQFSTREKAIVVEFDKDFIDLYYEQLIDIFNSQNLNPTFSKEKIYELAEAFKQYPDMVFTQKAIDGDGKCVGTILSFGYGEWAYYLCAAQLRTKNNSHPGEGLFWEMIKHWNANGQKHLDLVGVRNYKLRYKPEYRTEITFIFEKVQGMYFMKNIIKEIVVKYRKFKGVLNKISI